MVRGIICRKMNNNALAFFFFCSSHHHVVFSFGRFPLVRVLPVQTYRTPHFSVYSTILAQLCLYHRLHIEGWICNSVRGWTCAPQLYAFESICLLWTKFLLHSRLSPHCPDIWHCVWLQGVQDKVNGLRFYVSPCSKATFHHLPVMCLFQDWKHLQHYPPHCLT